MISRDRRRCEDAFRPDDSHRRALDHPDLLPLWRRAEPSRPLDLHRTATGGFASRSRRTGSDQLRSSIQLEHHRTAQTMQGRSPRSRSDRAAIEPRSRRDRAAITRLLPQNRPYLIRRRPRTTIEPRSWPDRGSIVVLKSWK